MSDKNPLKWKIYYGDGSVFSGNPEDAPERDVQVIVQEDSEVGWTTIHVRDFYVWKWDQWLGVDLFGLWDYLASPGWKRVLFGRTMKRSEYNDIYKQAKSDKNFANKAGWLPGEIR